MAKRSQRRPIRHEKDQAGGCIWGLMSMFDFRNGRSTRKLLSDSRSGNRQAEGVGYSTSQLLLTNSDEKCRGINDGVERQTLAADTAKTSVKELMEEEMFSENEAKNRTDGADIELRDYDSEGGGRAKKSRKRRNKTRKRSFDVNAPKNLELDNSCHEVSEQKTLNNLDLEVIMEELCHQIHKKSTEFLKHDDLNVQSNQKSSVVEEKLSEAFKVFVDQKFTHGKHPTEDGKIQHSKELIDALETLSSNKDLFFKLLRDPNSVLVKHIEDLGIAELERDQNYDMEINLRPSELVNRKQHNFFRRKSKSKERDPLKENENFRPTSRIVVLKPGPAKLQNSENESKLRSSLQFRDSLGNKEQGDKIASQFSFSEIKRKLKHAMGKDSHRLSADGVENGGWSSPNRNHFYTERFARFSTGTKRGEGIVKPKDTEISIRNEYVGHSERRVSNICIEAKKHLSEMLRNGIESEEISSTQSPKSLGRILSLPEFNFSPICSPGKDNLVNAQMRFSPYENSHVANLDKSRITQENHVSNPRESLEIEPCINSCEELKAPISDPCVVDELNHADAVEETLSSTRDDACSEGDVEIVKATATLSQEESEVLDVSAEKSSFPVAIDGENGEITETCDEDKSLRCLKTDSLEEDQSFSSPSTSPSSYSIIKKADDLESASERPARPSPVSVLEPLFTDDDISPASIKTQPGEKTIHLLPINLEEQISSSVDHGICLRISTEDEESTFEYVEAVLLGSGLNWDEFLLRWLSSEDLLEPSLFDEVELFSSRPSHEQKLLFDCANEVLKRVCERYFGFSSRVPHAKKNIRPIPRGKDLISEVWEGVEWNLLSQPIPRNLDQIVRKDLSKSGRWMDLQFDYESIGVEIGEAIFEELIENITLSFISEDSEKGISCDFDRVEE